MLGRVAVAPEGEEAFDGLWPGPFGGNMDASDVREGTTVYLPVFHPGALFYFGDGHALQGDGEVCGSGLETSMEVAFRFGLLKKKAIEWPRLEDATHIMVAGSARPLSDALRIAFVELIAWLEADYGFGRADAYQLVSQVAEVRVANMVDPGTRWSPSSRSASCRRARPRMSPRAGPPRSAQRRRHRHPVLGDAAEERLPLLADPPERAQIRGARRGASPNHVDEGLAVHAGDCRRHARSQHAR